VSAPTSNAVRARVRELDERGLSKRAIGREVGISHTTVGRILAADPFSGGSQATPNIPVPERNIDQPPPPPEELQYDPRYHGHTFRASAKPAAIDGWDLERIRDAVSLHDEGIFFESSMLSIVATRFGPVFAALGQALAPALGLPRYIRGGDRGLSRVLREEVEQQLAPRSGLSPSPYFPPTLWGAMQFDLAQMGFTVLQHVHGDEDPDTGVRRIYSRRWPTWAVQEDKYRQTYQAITLDGPVDIINGDGKFTLIGDTTEPHLDGAIRALGTEILDGSLVKQARASYVDRYGNPKWVVKMPPNVQTNSPKGQSFFSAVQTIQGPDGVGIFPHGTEYEAVQMTAQQSTVFKDSLDNIWQYVAAILLGTDGTMSPSTGVYSAPIFAGVRRDIVQRRLMAMVRGVNSGHIAPWLVFNYATSIAMASGWVEPALDIPLPDPQADARIKSYAERVMLLPKIVKAERDAGFIVDQTRVNQLAERLDIAAPTLAKEKTAKGWNVTLAPTTQEKLLRVDEGRAALGGDPVGDERGELFISELEERAAAEREAKAAAAQAEAEAKAAIEVDQETDDDEPPDNDEGTEGGDDERNDDEANEASTEAKAVEELRKVRASLLARLEALARSEGEKRTVKTENRKQRRVINQLRRTLSEMRFEADAGAEERERLEKELATQRAKVAELEKMPRVVVVKQPPPLPPRADFIARANAGDPAGVTADDTKPDEDTGDNEES